jgi:hypothetical protein
LIQIVEYDLYIEIYLEIKFYIFCYFLNGYKVY